MTKRRIAAMIVIGIMVAAALFAAGVFTARPDLISRDGLHRVLARLGIAVEESGPRIIRTALLTLVVDEFPLASEDLIDSPGGGGSIAALGNEILGVEKHGRFFHFNEETGFTPLDLFVQTNMEKLPEGESVPKGFRFLDIGILDRGGGIDLFVSYAYWHAARQCKTVRLSVARAASLAQLIAESAAVQWKVIFESTPCIPYRDQATFLSGNNGGEIAFLDRDRLLLSIGDHELDGLHNKPAASQIDSMSYGKVYEIDLNTLGASIFAKGLRNPQGLSVDAEGNVWETEHGPQGGDELNLLVEGGNYGWPFATYGTSYTLYTWPLNEAQGRHSGYLPPLYAWVPSVGLSANLSVQGFADVWDGDLLAASLRAGTLFRIRLEDGRVTVVEPIRVGDRIRDLVQLADGAIVLWTDDHRILLLRTGEDVPLPFADVLDEDLAETVTRCATCHGLYRGDMGYAGPRLWGVFGRAVGSENYPLYSEALLTREGRWNEESLRQFLQDPQLFAPGTTMPRPDVGGPEELDPLIDYLRLLRD